MCKLVACSCAINGKKETAWLFLNENQPALMRSSDDWQPLWQAEYLQNHLDETGLFYTWSHTCAKPIKYQTQTVKLVSISPSGSPDQGDYVTWTYAVCSLGQEKIYKICLKWLWSITNKYMLLIIYLKLLFAAVANSIAV